MSDDLRHAADRRQAKLEYLQNLLSRIKEVTMPKPNCYECKHRRSIPGDAHSNCQHPKLNRVNDTPMIKIMAIFASVGRSPPVLAGVAELGIKANYHGVRKGWFNFPFNFDPVWLEECNGFEAKE